MKRFKKGKLEIKKDEGDIDTSSWSVKHFSVSVLKQKVSIYENKETYSVYGYSWSQNGKIICVSLVFYSFLHPTTSLINIS